MVSELIADAQNLPFENKLFIAVLTESVTAFLADIQKTVSENAHVTKPGGYVGLNEAAWLIVPVPPEVCAWTTQSVGASIKPLTPNKWIGLLDTTGLKEIVSKSFAIAVQNEAKWILQLFGRGGTLRVTGRTLRLYMKSPFYRDLAKRVRQSGIVPDKINEYFGYGLFVGQ